MVKRDFDMPKGANHLLRLWSVDGTQYAKVDRFSDGTRGRVTVADNVEAFAALF